MKRPISTVTIYIEILEKTPAGFSISRIVARINEKIPNGEILFKLNIII